MKTAVRSLLAVLLLAAVATAQSPPAAKPSLDESLKSLADGVATAIKDHQALYLRTKTPETASKLPAILWHVGDFMTQGGDLTADFTATYELGGQRDATKLQAVADQADATRPKAEALGTKTAETAAAARDLAARIREAAKGGAVTVKSPDAATLPSRESEPGLLLGLALDALAATPQNAAQAAAAMDELAARLDLLSDLDRWTAINCQWLSLANAWTKTEGLAARTLCYSIQARGSEFAALQSRVEDALSTTEAEKAAWAWTVARAADPKSADAARPDKLIADLPEMRTLIADLRQKDVTLDRELAALCHERKLSVALPRRAKEYMPLVARLEYAQREAAILARLAAAKPGDLLVDDVAARPLSQTARAALAAIAAKLDPKAAAAIAPVLKQMLARDYLVSYADLCLYQAAVMDTAPALAGRLNRWAALAPEPTVRGLMDMLHPMHGVISTAERADNAYDPRILKWSAECTGKTPMDRFVEARDLVNAFYKEHGYNQDQPVYTTRDALDSGLVDCIAASRLHGSVAASAGLEGIVPVRLWRQKTGHSFLGLRTAEGLMLLDPLTRDAARKYPVGGSGVMTIETGAMSFGSYVVDDVVIFAGDRRLHLDLPYLADPPPGK